MQVKTNNWVMKKNKQFIVKLCHKYIHNINEDILQIYIILQYTHPFRREPFQQQTVLLYKNKCCGSPNSQRAFIDTGLGNPL